MKIPIKNFLKNIQKIRILVALFSFVLCPSSISWWPCYQLFWCWNKLHSEQTNWERQMGSRVRQWTGCFCLVCKHHLCTAPVTPCQPYPAHPDRDKATFWKKPRWVLYSLLKSSLFWGCLSRRHLTWRPILRGSRWLQAPKIFCCHAGPRIENLVYQKTSLSLILSVWICYLRRKRGNQSAGWRTLTIAVWLTSCNFRDLEILSSGENQQNSKKTNSMFH